MLATCYAICSSASDVYPRRFSVPGMEMHALASPKQGDDDCITFETRWKTVTASVCVCACVLARLKPEPKSFFFKCILEVSKEGRARSHVEKRRSWMEFVGGWINDSIPLPVPG